MDKDEYHGYDKKIPVHKPLHPEIKKMYEDYFDKCFRESSAQQRPWVGLTDDEVNLIYAEPQTHVGQYAKAIETKLREKNT